MISSLFQGVRDITETEPAAFGSSNAERHRENTPFVSGLLQALNMQSALHVGAVTGGDRVGTSGGHARLVEARNTTIGRNVFRLNHSNAQR
jgi:hypothetical protein